jgi:hypothetical protein
MASIFKLNKWAVFTYICIISVILSFAMRELVLTLDLYYDAFSEQITWERFEKNFNKQKEWAWVGYVAIPLVLVIKLTLIATCLSIGVF